MGIKNYIWDFDGTLYDSYPVMVEGAIKALKYFGIVKEPKEVYKTMKKFSIRQLREDYQLKEEDFSLLFHQYERESSLKIKPFGATEEVLRTLKKNGARHFILTHRYTESTWDLLENYGLTNLIEEVIGIDQCFPRKPSPDALNYLIEHYQMRKSETMMIGDRRLDIEAGKRAGILTCLYDIDHFLGEIPATYVIDDLRGILAI